MKRHIPNALTLSRLAMAAAMFVLLAFYDAAGEGGAVLLDVALALFVVAGLSDVLDGYLARRWNTSSTFGRIVDPFTDKVLVCGAFIYFAGSNFLLPGDGGRLASLSGVAPWMAVVIFAREILVTGIRGFSESRDLPFATTVFGKSKMALQWLTIAWILLLTAHGRTWGHWATLARDILVWATVVVTVATAFVYVGRTRRLMRTATPPEGTPPKQ